MFMFLLLNSLQSPCQFWIFIKVSISLKFQVFPLPLKRVFSILKMCILNTFTVNNYKDQKIPALLLNLSTVYMNPFPQALYCLFLVL